MSEKCQRSNSWDYEKNVPVPGWYVYLDCPCEHGLFLRGDRHTMTGTVESPTFNPSVIATSCGCHYFIRDGVAYHCADSKFADQEMALKDINA